MTPTQNIILIQSADAGWNVIAAAVGSEVGTVVNSYTQNGIETYDGNFPVYGALVVGIPASAGTVTAIPAPAPVVLPFGTVLPEGVTLPPGVTIATS